MTSISWLDYNFLIFTIVVWFFLLWNWCVNFFKVFFFNYFNFIFFFLIRKFFWLNLKLYDFLVNVFVFFYLFIFFYEIINEFFRSFIFFYFSNVIIFFMQKIILKKYSMFFTFYEFTFYQIFRVPIFIFWGFNFWYTKKPKPEFFLVENYGNVSSIKYNMYDYPFRRLKFLDNWIKKLFDWIDSLSFEPVVKRVNSSIPPFFINLNCFIHTKRPIFSYMLYWPVWLVFFYWPFFQFELYFIKLFNFLFLIWISQFFYSLFLFYELKVDYSFTIYFLYFYYFFCKFFSIIKLLFHNLLVFFKNNLKKVLLALALYEIFLINSKNYRWFLFLFYILKGLLLLTLSLFQIFWFFLRFYLLSSFEFINPMFFLRIRWFDFGIYFTKIDDFYSSKKKYLKRSFFWLFWFK